MKTPLLSRRLVLLSPARVADGAGGFTETWEEVAVLWGEVRARTGREARDRAGADLSVTGYRIRLRALPEGLDGRPRAGQRLRDQLRRYRIDAVTEDDAAGRYLMCFATEEVVT